MNAPFDCNRFHEDRLAATARLFRMGKGLPRSGSACRDAFYVGVLRCIIHRSGESMARAAGSREALGTPLPEKPAAVAWAISLACWAAACLFHVLVLRKRRGKALDPAACAEREIYVSKGFSYNGNKQLLEYIKQSPEGSPVTIIDVDTGFFRGSRSPLPERILRSAEIIRPYTWAAFFKAIPDSLRYMGIIARLCAELRQWGPEAGVGSRLFHLWRNMLRGHALALYFAPLRPREGQCAVFDNITTDTSILDWAFRKKGLSTVQWSHGVMEDPYAYFAFSDVCISNNAVDAEVRRQFGAYGRVESFPVEPPSRPAGEGSAPLSELILLTNLLHSGHQIPLEHRVDSLRQLFRALGNIPELRVAWFPHPMEMHSPHIHEFMTLAREMNMPAGKPGEWKKDFKPGSPVISTYSGAVRDALSMGALPVVWNDIHYARYGLWAAYPRELEFSDGGGLRSALAAASGYLETPQKMDGLVRQMAAGTQALPPYHFFAKEYSFPGKRREWSWNAG